MIMHSANIGSPSKSAICDFSNDVDSSTIADFGDHFVASQIEEFGQHSNACDFQADCSLSSLFETQGDVFIASCRHEPVISSIPGDLSYIISSFLEDLRED